MIGTSIVPKFYVTPLTQYGTIEVNASKRDTLLIENSSPFVMTIDSLAVTAGFNLIYPIMPLSRTLNPGDSIWAIVDFNPKQSQFYQGNILVFSNSPCKVENEGVLEGKGEIIPLELSISTISFGFVRPCDCFERFIPLINKSKNFRMTVDDVWIDSIGIANGTPDLFTWRSAFSPDGRVPYSILPAQIDTMWIKYCPRSPADRAYIDNNARLNIKAHGSGWDGEYETFLSGKRMLMMEPLQKIVEFPPTRVDTFAASRYVNIIVPDVNVNPAREDLRIDTIYFDPPERVFFASDSLKRTFEETGGLPVDKDGNLSIQLDFKPRAVRFYEAKMHIQISSPCETIDTTVYVSGSGFAPAYGLGLEYLPGRAILDTFRVIGCDTLVVPVYSSREIPADLVDINCRLGYDTTKLRYVGADSPYFADTCSIYPPYIQEQRSQYGGSEILAKNLCYVDSTKPFMYAKFLPMSIKRDTFRITVDSITFDTEGVILYHLIAAGDEGVVVILEPDFEIQNSIDFDSVRVLDCAEGDIAILNTGDVPMAVKDLLDLPKGVEIINSVPPLGTPVDVGEEVIVTIRYCPLRQGSMTKDISAEMIDPCSLVDTTNIQGIAYVPEFPFFVDISSSFAIPDTISGRIGDTINVPLIFEKDFATVYNSITYWLNGLTFKAQVNYNKYALKYLEHNNLIDSELEVNYVPGLIEFLYSEVDTLKAGEFANVDFLVTVPDSVLTSIYIDAFEFDTDSIFFLEPLPEGSPAILISGENCNLSYLRDVETQSKVAQNSPNPWSDRTKIRFSLGESSNPKLHIYNASGELVWKPLDGNIHYRPGEYEIELYTGKLEPGVYFYTLEAGIFTGIKSMVVIK